MIGGTLPNLDENDNNIVSEDKNSNGIAQNEPIQKNPIREDKPIRQTESVKKLESLPQTTSIEPTPPVEQSAPIQRRAFKQGALTYEVSFISKKYYISNFCILFFFSLILNHRLF